MPDFAFDASQSFEQNLETFLANRDGADPELAAILRANVDKLRAIVKAGERDTRSRTEFNAAIVGALDQLIAPKEPEGAA
jgi:hypothetical protein